MTPTPAIELRGIRVQAGDRTILDVPALAIAPGERVTITGPNGAGKSTLLEVAALLSRPDAGEVLVEGEVADRRNTPKLRHRMAVSFQDPLLLSASVLSNAASGLRFRGMKQRDAEARARTWLDRFGVGHLADRSARVLSGGEGQRVNLARAFALEPAILLLDEPFAGLDLATRDELVPEVAGWLRDLGTTALVVTHDPWEARTLGDRVLQVREGRIVGEAG